MLRWCNIGNERMYKRNMGGMIQTGQGRSTRRKKMCQIATSSTTNSTTGLKLKPDLRGEGPAHNCLGHGMVCMVMTCNTFLAQKKKTQ